MAMPTGLGNLLGMMGPPSAEHPVTMMSPSRRARRALVGPGEVGKLDLGDLLEHVLLDPLMLTGMAGGVGMAASRKGGKWINKALGKVHRAEPFLDRRLLDKLVPVVSEQALSGADMLKARGMAEGGGRIPEAGIEAGLRGMDIPVGAESSALRASLETPGIGGAGSTWRMLKPGEAMPPSMSVGVDVSSPPRSFLARLLRRATGVGVSRDTADPAVRAKFAQQGGRVHGVMDRTKMVDVRQPGVLGELTDAAEAMTAREMGGQGSIPVSSTRPSFVHETGGQPRNPASAGNFEAWENRYGATGTYIPSQYGKDLASFGKEAFPVGGRSSAGPLSQLDERPLLASALEAAPSEQVMASRVQPVDTEVFSALSDALRSKNPKLIRESLELFKGKEHKHLRIQLAEMLGKDFVEAADKLPVPEVERLGSLAKELKQINRTLKRGVPQQAASEYTETDRALRQIRKDNFNRVRGKYVLKPEVAKGLDSTKQKALIARERQLAADKTRLAKTRKTEEKQRLPSASTLKKRKTEIRRELSERGYGIPKREPRKPLEVATGDKRVLTLKEWKKLGRKEQDAYLKNLWHQRDPLRRADASMSVEQHQKIQDAMYGKNLEVEGGTPAAVAPAAGPAAATGAATKFTTTRDAGYAERTFANAAQADVTVDFARSAVGSGGSRGLTKVAALKARKPYVNVPVTETGFDPQQAASVIVEQIKQSGVKGPVTLNMAGHGMGQLRASQQHVDRLVTDTMRIVKRELDKEGITLKAIRSGGQTGFDEAGVKAGMALGLETEVLAPRGWKYRPQSRDIIGDEAGFKARFTQPTAASTPAAAPAVTGDSLRQAKIREQQEMIARGPEKLRAFQTRRMEEKKAEDIADAFGRASDKRFELELNAPGMGRGKSPKLPPVKMPSHKELMEKAPDMATKGGLSQINRYAEANNLTLDQAVTLLRAKRELPPDLDLVKRAIAHIDNVSQEAATRSRPSGWGDILREGDDDWLSDGVNFMREMSPPQRDELLTRIGKHSPKMRQALERIFNQMPRGQSKTLRAKAGLSSPPDITTQQGTPKLPVDIPGAEMGNRASLAQALEPTPKRSTAPPPGMEQAAHVEKLSVQNVGVAPKSATNPSVDRLLKLLSDKPEEGAEAIEGTLRRIREQVARDETVVRSANNRHLAELLGGRSLLDSQTNRVRAMHTQGVLTPNIGVSEAPMLTPDQEAKMLMMLLAPGGLMSAGKNIELARQHQGA